MFDRKQSDALLSRAGRWACDLIAWWKIYRVIKAFYIVFAFFLIYLRGTEGVFGLLVIEQAIPWWLLIALMGAVVVILEAGQPVPVYAAALLPMLLYDLALLYGVLYRHVPLVGFLPVVYLTFGCLGFISGIYGTWRVRGLIARLKRFEQALEQHRVEQEANGHEPAA